MRAIRHATGPSRRIAPLRLVAALLGAIGAAVAPAPAAAEDMLFLEARAGVAELRLRFLPEDAADAARPVREGWRRLTITGAYSSGDRFAPEGFTLRAGDPTHPWPQGWDGLLLAGRDGRAAIFDVRAVEWRGTRYNLRDRAERRAFLAAADGASAVQSHLLIKDGALDLSDRAGAPRFRRRLLFAMPDGRLGVFDSSPRAMTLYEAAVALRDAVAPAMALNLDMGAYDYCVDATDGGARNCGVLPIAGDDKLTNLIEIEAPASP